MVKSAYQKWQESVDLAYYPITSHLPFAVNPLLTNQASPEMNRRTRLVVLNRVRMYLFLRTRACRSRLLRSGKLRVTHSYSCTRVL